MQRVGQFGSSCPKPAHRPGNPGASQQRGHAHELPHKSELSGLPLCDPQVLRHSPAKPQPRLQSPSLLPHARGYVHRPLLTANLHWTPATTPQLEHGLSLLLHAEACSRPLRAHWDLLLPSAVLLPLPHGPQNRPDRGQPGQSNLRAPSLIPLARAAEPLHHVREPPPEPKGSHPDPSRPLNDVGPASRASLTLSQPCPEELLSPQLPQIQPQNAKHYVDQQSELQCLPSAKGASGRWSQNYSGLQGAKA
mmetsp:Transcript_38105/g.77897  ORF Transcript_38105/g.77897 Transcript_38105/m.77897 type:complete len:250 (+) Transcript_38105:1038-1787(+)